MKYIFLIFFIVFDFFYGCGQTTYWQQQVNFSIDVSLNDVEHSLDAFETIEYINNSPDTLHFIWFHLWPDAYKNDKTAFSDQELENGNLKFYFSKKEQRGYINRLDFRIDGEVARTEDHPQYIDIIKLILPAPLPPGNKVIITTPFHVQLPENFSRGGHTGQSYQVTQWYPKPAVYDKNGWHPMPYLDQGEFYNEFGNYDVKIRLPKEYVVGSTGLMVKQEDPDAKADSLKMMEFRQDSVHDFAWFADKKYIVSSDTIQLPSGHVVQAFAYYYPEHDAWKNAISYIKDAIRFRSTLIGEYPFQTVSVVEAKMGFSGGMEYPTITSISPIKDEHTLEETIEHEVGHNWFQGMLATNEREYPWMDEGINTYYDLRYKKEKSKEQQSETAKKIEKFELNTYQVLLDTWSDLKKDQPINTPAADFSLLNYFLIVYMKTALWMERIENYSGKEKFDAAMRAYFETWKFKHPQPEDFRKILEEKTGKDLSSFFHQLDVKESQPVLNKHRKLKINAFYSFRDYKKYEQIHVFPVVGYNNYDQLMLGAAIHNLNLPLDHFQFILVPLYATNSRQLTGIGRISYLWLPDKKIYSVDAGLSGERFSSLKGIDSNNNKVFGGFYKAVPFVKIVFNNKSPRNKEVRWIDFRTFIIGEKGFDYFLKKADSIYYPSGMSYSNRYINQLTFGTDNYRALYPYDGRLQIQQGSNFYRASAEGNCFFNYSSTGGMNVRLFAAKFGYIGGKTTAKEFETFAYQPKLTAVRGNEDYTYSNYFIGRNENEGFLSQQIMMRDGNLKLRTDLFQGLQGRSDNWVAAMNFNTTIPKKLIPLPIKLFLDVGTYADAWNRSANTSRFLYVGGLQLSLFNDLINIYLPVIYSKEFRDQLKSLPDENKLIKKLSFSIDIQRINFNWIVNKFKLQ